MSKRVLTVNPLMQKSIDDSLHYIFRINDLPVKDWTTYGEPSFTRTATRTGLFEFNTNDQNAKVELLESGRGVKVSTRFGTEEHCFTQDLYRAGESGPLTHTVRHFDFDLGELGEPEPVTMNVEDQTDTLLAFQDLRLTMRDILVSQPPLQREPE